MNSDNRRLALIAYDIVDDRRRDRVAKLLQSHGDRVQYSVFLMEASPARLLRLRADLLRRMILLEDSVMICDLGQVPAALGTVTWLGRQRGITDSGSMIV